ncbi:hypothetical protein SAMN05444678_103212 [Sphingomonas sp. YR710]|uniref:hypothetical protein n=1 Tax=Sphingomonas sp. YR710 TaxID=1882773 RepID=UPI0008880726|nr:hypothetical protein [Sphingomonas sp. YR710]SDC50205.1 hypothetical protein SAMN05444678_103212 [Sphingomonas sp. YR710]
MAQYRAPAHVHSIALSSGHHAVRNGMVELPETLNESDRAGLSASGFVAVASPEPDLKKKA